MAASMQNTGADRQKRSLQRGPGNPEGPSAAVLQRVQPQPHATRLHQQRQLRREHPLHAGYIPSFIPITKQADGTYPQPPITYKGANPLQTAELQQNDDNTGRFTSGLKLSYQALSTAHNTLNVVGGGGMDYFNTRATVFGSPELYFERSFANPGVNHDRERGQPLPQLNVNAVDAYAPAGGRFTATTSAGLQYEDQNLARNAATSRASFRPVGDRPGVGFGGALETRATERTFALYAQEELLTFSERLLLTAGVRSERASNAGDVKKYNLYPKVSASVSPAGSAEQGERAQVPRGVRPRRAIAPPSARKFTTLGVGTIAGQAGTFVGGVSGDPNISPERVKELEGGIDMSFGGGRGTLEVTAYDRKTVNMLLDVAAIPSSGFSRRFSNDAEMRNRGLRSVPVGRSSSATISAARPLDVHGVTATRVLNFQPRSRPPAVTDRSLPASAPRTASSS